MQQTPKRIFTGSLCVATILLLMGTACEKPQSVPVSFEISGSKDIVLTENGSDIVPLNIEYLSGEEDQVTLSLSGLPEGVTARFSAETGKPSFTSSLYLKDDSSKGGKYYITLTGSSSRGPKREYDFTITTTNKICAKRIASSTYTGTLMCRDGKGESFNTFTFTEDSANMDKLWFTWNNHPKKVYMLVNCNRNQVTVPRQDVGTFKIQGQGYTEENNRIIYFNYLESHNNGDTVSCLARFERK